MSRYDDDIPEIFRRAMEEAGWETGKQDEPERPAGRPPTLSPWWSNRWLWIILLVLLFLASLTWLVTTYTDWLWFQEVGYAQAWLIQFGATLITFLVFFVVAAGVILLAWLLARRISLAASPMGPPLLRLGATRWLIVVAALFLSYVLGSAAAGRAMLFLRYLNQVPFELADPIFGRDVSFYIFTLPVLSFLHGWLLPLVVLTLLGVVIIFLAGNLPAVRNGRFRVQALPLAFRQMAAALLALFFGLWAFGYWLNIYELLFSPRGVAFGASYTDLHSTLLALRVQMVLMALLAVAVALNVVRFDLRPALAVGVLWLAATLILGTVYPGVQQRYVVEPNELALERPYIAHNINFTRQGFGLADVERRDFSQITELTGQDLADREEALRNIRLWDYRPLGETYAQLQQLRPYYTFGEIDIDRYEIDGVVRQVMLAGRELEGLSDPTWVNEKLEFTHGYGVVMNPVDEKTPQGQPIFYIQDLPPRSTIDIEVTRPEIYYGEMTDQVVFAGSALEEFDYPSGDENVYSSYAGEGGVPLGNFLRRLAFAYRFGDVNVLFSQYITPDTRAMYYRVISDRVSRIAPFLVQDHDPYLVITDAGRMVWIMDTYTVSGNFPYSQPLQARSRTIPAGTNYIRNAVKVTIDAYDGTVNFYVAAPNDPLIRTYQQIFPDLFRPLEEMPADLQRHIRYPEGLFLVQAQQYLIYHMTEVQVFYNREDVWSVPLEQTGQEATPMEPYYITFPLPGEEDAEFLLILPFTPAGRNNMIGWMAARSDPPNYGELVIFELPKQELVFGPIQVEGRIDQDPFISQQFSLWDQRGSGVIRGNLIVVPINNSFLYVEPIYLRANASALPELQRVIVASGDRIAMRNTLPEALAALVEGDVVATLEGLPEGAGLLTGDESIDELIRSAGEHFEAAQAAQQAGDWATYGQELELLEEALNRLLELTGEPVPEEAVEPTPEPEAGE